MTNGRLSLEAFKAKTENMNTNEVLEKIQGGSASECHGVSTQLGKVAVDFYHWFNK